jgi:hypothetical protein
MEVNVTELDTKLDTKRKRPQTNYDTLCDDNTLNNIKYPWGMRYSVVAGRVCRIPLSFDEWWMDQLHQRQQPELILL